VKTRVALVALALSAAIAPAPASIVERLYSNGVYPAMQGVMTRLTNFVPVALLDLSGGALLTTAIVVFVRRARRVGIMAAARRTAGSAVVLAAVLYLWFLAMWGMNYRRVPLEQKLDYQAARVTHDDARRLANEAVTRVNLGYAAAHATNANDHGLEASLARATKGLGARYAPFAGIPKRSLLTLYFRRAAIDGMTDPFFLEIIVNQDVLPVERPFVLAHEWAHLAGYANEAEANFVAWLTCLYGDDLTQYSGWLAAYEHAAQVLTRDERRALSLDAGPRADLDAIVARYRRSSPVVREAAREVYDRYLRANRVREGIESYDEVLRLMLGTRFDDQWRPALRSTLLTGR
jgi:hypothetical protein